MKGFIGVLAYAAVLAGVLASPCFAAEKWFLLSRHGECADMAVLKRKFPDLGTVSDPHAFVQFVQAKGLKVELQPADLPAGRGYQVNVPDSGLAVLFVTAEVCSPPSATKK